MHHHEHHGHAHHGHAHHGHGHHAHRSRSKNRLLATLAVTSLIMVAEGVGGFWAGSLALVADAGHMLTDVLAIVVTLAALMLSSRPADPKRTYGYRRVEVLAALLNGMALMLVCGFIVIEAVRRWMHPEPIHSGTMSIIATVGLVANLSGLWLLRNERHNLNMRSAFLHILGDTLSSIGVLLAAGIIALTGFTRLDSLVSIGITAIICVSTYRLLKEVIEVLLESAPPGIQTEDVLRTIQKVPGISQVHDLHIWSISSGLPALSAHIVVDDAQINTRIILQQVQEQLRKTYAITHSTLQIEDMQHATCELTELACRHFVP